jgi:hypothetical protein
MKLSTTQIAALRLIASLLQDKVRQFDGKIPAGDLYLFALPKAIASNTALSLRKKGLTVSGRKTDDGAEWGVKLSDEAKQILASLEAPAAPTSTAPAAQPVEAPAAHTTQQVEAEAPKKGGILTPVVCDVLAATYEANRKEGVFVGFHSGEKAQAARLLCDRDLAFWFDGKGTGANCLRLTAEGRSLYRYACEKGLIVTGKRCAACGDLQSLSSASTLCDRCFRSLPADQQAQISADAAEAVTAKRQAQPAKINLDSQPEALQGKAQRAPAKIDPVRGGEAQQVDRTRFLLVLTYADNSKPITRPFADSEIPIGVAKDLLRSDQYPAVASAIVIDLRENKAIFWDQA